jgi:hypothetical protein
MFRFRGNAARNSLWLDTIPRVHKHFFPKLAMRDHRQDGYITVGDGSEIWVSGLDEKERIEKILGQEFCVDPAAKVLTAPAAKVLTADLRWVPVVKLSVGDEIIAFPENLDGHQVLKRAKIERFDIITAERYRVTTNRGETIVSARHMFVSYRDDRRHRNFRSLSWRATEDLKVGDKIRYACEPWRGPDGYDDGWMAGLLDGEGWLSVEGGQVGVARLRSYGGHRPRRTGKTNKSGLRTERRPDTPHRFEDRLQLWHRAA